MLGPAVTFDESARRCYEWSTLNIYFKKMNKSKMNRPTGTTEVRRASNFRDRPFLIETAQRSSDPVIIHTKALEKRMLLL